MFFLNFIQFIYYLADFFVFNSHCHVSEVSDQTDIEPRVDLPAPCGYPPKDLVSGFSTRFFSKLWPFPITSVSQISVSFPKYDSVLVMMVMSLLIETFGSSVRMAR